MNNISDNWVIRNLENAIGTWNEKLAELWQLLTQTPESFKGGQIWGVIVNIHSALVGVGYGLLVLFFAMGVDLLVRIMLRLIWHPPGSASRPAAG